jgi:hypothetical protein
MIEGNWTEAVTSTRPPRRAAQVLETILTGKAGGSWAAREVRLALARHTLADRVHRRAPAKHARIPGLLDASITEIKGRDRSKPVVFENIFTRFAPTQVLALGSTAYDDGMIRIATKQTHGLHSRFEWIVS